MSSFDYSRFDNLCDSDDESDAPAAAVPPVPPKRSTLADIAPELAAKIHRNLEDEEAKENVKAKVNQELAGKAMAAQAGTDARAQRVGPKGDRAVLMARLAGSSDGGDANSFHFFMQL